MKWQKTHGGETMHCYKLSTYLIRSLVHQFIGTLIHLLAQFYQHAIDSFWV